MANWQPKTFKPEHIHIVRLHWNGYDNSEIAQFLGCSETHVSLVLNCDEAKRLLQQLREHTIDSFDDTQDDFQLVLPLVRREKIKLALEATDERVRNIACSDILAIAGHSPVRRLEVSRTDRKQSDPEKMTPDELRDAILNDIGLQRERQEAVSGTPDALDSKGPDPD